MSRLLRLVRPGTVVFAAAAVGAALLSVPAAAATSRVALAGARPSWARTADGAPSSAQRIDMNVYLGWRNAADLDAFIQRVSTPGGADSGKFLTPAQFRSRYAPTNASVARVRDFLTAAGLSVGQIPANHAYIPVNGTVAQAEKAFGTRLANYRMGGRQLRAPATTVSVPSDLAGLVSGVSGLSQPAMMKKMAPAPKPPAGFRNSPPFSSYYGEKTDTTDPAVGGYNGKKLPYVPRGYTPKQLEGAYGTSGLVKRGLNGHGATVAIVDAFFSGTLYADAAKYASNHGPAPLTTGQYSELIHKPNVSNYPANKCDASGWIGEQSLDVESVHSMAPGANILYVGASDCQDSNLATAVADIVDHHRADVVTNSYGSAGTEVPDPPSVAQFNHQVAQQAAATGISLLFSSGDDGDSATVTGNGQPSLSDPENDPLVTSVGGTSLGVTKSNGYGFETGWSTGSVSLKNGAWSGAYPGDFLYGGGGGTSRVWAEPWYQKGVVPNAIATKWGKAGRVAPDVSMVGDPNTGMLIGHTQTFPDGVKYGEYRLGGTSLSSPLFAGQLALAVQANRGRGLGFVNPALYHLNGSGALRDVQAGPRRGVVRVDYANSVDASKGLTTTARLMNVPQTILTRKGYDDVTGVGSPNGAAFIGAMAALR